MEWGNILPECVCSTSLLLIALCVSAAYILRNRKRNFPPGPRGLPVVGYAPFLGDHFAETLRKMKLKYGPVMSIQLGMENWVVLNDFDSIYQGLVKQGDKFSGRPNNYVLNLVTEGKGIVFADNGKPWKHLRKFGLMTLRGFGVGKKSTEENVIEEIPYLLEELTKNDNKPHDMKLTNAVSNIICRVTFGRRYDYDDEQFSTLTRIFREFFSEDNPDYKIFGILTAAPILRHFPVFRGALKRIMKECEEFLGVMRDIVKEHQADFDKDDIRDFIDAFLVEMDKPDADKEIFNEVQLLQYVRDLFEAGSGTTSSTLAWAILAFVNYPECQEKIADEIEKTIGNSGSLSMKHRDQMNYTCAFIQEIMRYNPILPTALIHRTTQKATIHGYTLPENTPVIPNIWAVHHDPELFENPGDFRPERFLDREGKFVKSTHVIPFSVGPRHCLGEQLARIEVFVFLTGIVQKLKVLPDPANPPPPLSSGTLALLSTYEPPEYRVLFENR